MVHAESFRLTPPAAPERIPCMQTTQFRNLKKSKPAAHRAGQAASSL